MADRGRPTPGRVVHYQTDQRAGLRYILPAMVVVTEESYVLGPLERPAGPGMVHLRVFSPGVDYVELSVPYDDSDEPAPRTWHWPPIV